MRTCSCVPTPTHSLTLAFAFAYPSVGFQECPGHLGHIELTLPVYNPTLFADALKLLKLKCFACHRLRAPAAKARLLRAQLMLLDLGRLSDALELEGRIRSVPDRRAAEALIARLAAPAEGAGKAARSKGAKAAAAAAAAAADATADAELEELLDPDAQREAADARAEAALAAVELDCLAAGGPDAGCGLSALGGAGRYSAHVRRVREQLVADFLAGATPPRVCANCGALAFKVRKDGHSKVFATGLNAAEEVKMRAAGVRYLPATTILSAVEARELQLLQQGEGFRHDDKRRGGGGGGGGGAAAAAAAAGSISGHRAAAAAAAAAPSSSVAAADGAVDADDGVGFEPEADAASSRRRRRRGPPAGPEAAVAAVLAELSYGAYEEGSAPLGVGDDDLAAGLASDAEADDDGGGEADGGKAAPAARRRRAAGGSSAAAAARPTRFVPTPEVAAHLQLLWARDGETLRRIYLPARSSSGARARASAGAHGASPSSPSAGACDGWRAFFLRLLPVPPPRFRPAARVGDMTSEHPQNTYLTAIIRLNDTMVDLGLGKTRGGAAAAGAVKAEAAAAAALPAGGGRVDLAASIRAMIDLQKAVNGLMDAGKLEGKDKKNGPPGIRQLLERKEGLFRMHMMGKRVNFAARSVISPDPYLNTDQVGVPLRFARTLSYKVGVTPFNVALMRQLVTAGSRNWPGATHVEDESGAITDLSTLSKAKREKIAKELLTPSANSGSGPSGAAGALTMLSASGAGAAASSSAGGADGLAAATLARGAAASAGRSAGGAGVFATGGSGGAIIDLDPGSAAAGAAANARGSSGVGVKRVWRHLLDDDIVLMNRQPTLHKPSIMAKR